MVSGVGVPIHFPSWYGPGWYAGPGWFAGGDAAGTQPSAAVSFAASWAGMGSCRT